MRQLQILKLTIKKKWFDMILSGEKKEEYRELSGYWKSRLAIQKGDKAAKQSLDALFYLGLGYDFLPRTDFNKVHFFNGGSFSKKYPNFIVELKEIEIGTGNVEWGAEPGKEYFVLMLGKIIHKK